MNKKAMEIGMTRTVFANSHGLANSLNKSCASDVVVMASYALRNPRFREIVSCKSYSATISEKVSQTHSRNKQVKW